MSSTLRAPVLALVILLAGTLISPAEALAGSSPPRKRSPMVKASGDEEPDLARLARSDSPVASSDEPRAVGNVAHRGASLRAPENTLAAIRQAIARGGNFVGIDVRRTRDGQLVVLHDPSLRRTTNVESVFPGRAPWLVEDFTLKEVKRLDAGSWMSPIFIGERVPTLAEMLDEMADSGTGMFLEIKSAERYGGMAAGGIGPQVVAEVREHTDWLTRSGPEDRIVVQAFARDRDFLRELSEKFPAVPIGVLGDVRGELDEYGWADQINVQFRDVTADFVHDAHDKGLAVASFVANERATMDRLVAAGVDAISTDHSQLLRRALETSGRLMHIARLAELPREPAGDARWSLDVARRALLGARVRVDATVRRPGGEPARWSTVHVGIATEHGFRPLQRPRVTDRHGRLHTTVEARRGLTVQLRAQPTAWYYQTLSPAADVHTRRARTTGRIVGPHEVVDEHRLRLRIRWFAEDGRPVTGSAHLWARPGGHRWRRVRRVDVVDGRTSIRVRPRRNTRYELRFHHGPWWHPDRDRHYVDNVPPGERVRMPRRAPRPDVHLSPQRRAVGAGLNAETSRIRRPVWRRMTGRSWHRGCPVGRSRLRLVRLNYWGYDGYRHRGEIVVARGARVRAIRSFREMYRHRDPIRSLRAVSRFRGGLRRSYAAGNSSGFYCAGARHPGPHAHGRAVTVNPWMNPVVTGHGVSPDRWWLRRTRRSEPVHRSRRDPVVRAFRHHGFRWDTRRQAYGRFVLR